MIKQTIAEALYNASELLTENKITSVHLDAEVILSFIIKKPREYLYTHPEKILSTAQSTAYKKLISKRAKHFPVAYITGHKEFFGLDFLVNENVLIPRPETEFLVEQTITAARQAKNNITIADIGTGSGCVAVALAKNLPETKIFATDISKKAIQLAKKNAGRRGVQVSFLRGHLLTPLKNKKIDIIVANLPYLPRDYKHDSIKFEPKIALYAANSGLSLYEKLFQQIARLKHQPKFILIEAGSIQIKSLVKIIKKKLPQAKVTVKKNPNNKQKIIFTEI